MTNSNNILSIWGLLETEKTPGLVKRLYSADIKYHIYATFLFPQKYYGVAFTFRNDIKIDVTSFDNLKELNVILLVDKSFNNSQILVIQLLSPSYKDIFASLCENLIKSVIKHNNEQQISRTIINQLEKWKTLFEKNNTTGLSLIEQQGLYGELHFLQKFLKSSGVSYCDVLYYWVGVDNAMRDFQGENWAVEVKTTSTNNPQKVIINGERQLDETFLEQLFLFHVSVEISNGNGQTIIQKISEIREMLSNNMPALSIFNSKLFEAGYLDKQSLFYQDRFYKIRSESLYDVKGKFPRIKESELRKGVSDIKYSIILAMCDEYLVSENQLFNLIKSL